MVIPNNVTFNGSISSADASAMICVAESGRFNPQSANNVSGTIRNYSKAASIQINSVFSGTLQNFGGTIIVYATSQIYSGKHILNCSGRIFWYNALNINGQSIYNGGQINIYGQVSGSGCLHNEGWFSADTYAGALDITNNGKLEVVGTSMHFNGGNVTNNCALFSNADGASFQNNTSIENNGLIYLPIGTFRNINSKTFTNGSSGVVRTRDLVNEGTVTGSGYFYVSRTSHNMNQGVFGVGNDTLQFYDASPIVGRPVGHFDILDQANSVGQRVKIAPFPEPTYSPDLSNYACGDIVLAGSIKPGSIASSQVLCNGVQPVPFESVVDATCSSQGATIVYQWQSSTDSLFFSNIAGANLPTYSSSRPAQKTFYRRKASAVFSPPDTVLNSSGMSNIVSLTPLTTNAAAITAHPANATRCSGQSVQFTASATNANSLRWQVSTNGGSSWSNLQNGTPYTGTTTGTLTISAVTSAMNNYRYRLMAINNSCGNVFSNAAALTVRPDDTPVIQTQPADQMKCPGATSAQFAVVVSSAGATYQWQRSTNGGATWNNLSNGASFSGVETNMLTISGAGMVNGHQFRCLLTATCNSVFSAAATLYLVTPQLVVAPVSQVKCPDAVQELQFNPLNHQFHMGNSDVVFTVTRLPQGPFNWQFHYSLSVSDASMILPEAQQPQAFVGTVQALPNSTNHDLVFFLENQTEKSVVVVLNISQVSVAGCPESSVNNPNHAAAIEVLKMPTVGAISGY
jgi:hypothetical protein